MSMSSGCQRRLSAFWGGLSTVSALSCHGTSYGLYPIAVSQHSPPAAAGWEGGGSGGRRESERGRGRGR